jgi:RLL motif-containing protein 1
MYCVAVDSPDFKSGVNALATLLQVTPHPDHLVTLRAISRLVSRRLNSDALDNPDLVVPKVCYRLR